ncbi:MAG: hydrolase [Polyangiaceae bacterium]|jgi:hypothetical protein
MDAKGWRFLLPLLFSAVACSGASASLPTLDAGLDATSVVSDGAADQAAADAGDATGAGDAAKDASVEEASVDASDAGPAWCAGLTVCDDFESTTVGQPPSSALWRVTAPECAPQRGTATVDDTEAHSGHHSVKIVNDFESGSPTYCDHVFFTNYSAFAMAAPGQIYARFFMFLGEPFGMTHVTFATMTDENDNGNQLRLGFDSNVFAWNRESDDAFLPELDDGSSQVDVQESIAPPSPGWFCVEFHIDELAGTLDAWVDGSEVPGLVETGTPVTNISAEWLGQGQNAWKPQVIDLGFGWETYFGQSMVLWFDDVAIASTRIGCTPPDQ